MILTQLTILTTLTNNNTTPCYHNITYNYGDITDDTKRLKFTLKDDVVNQNLDVDYVNLSKENILDIKKNGIKLL